MNVGDKVICLESGYASMCVVGQIYTVVKVEGSVIWLDNGVITFSDRFKLL